jgi:PAS domain S-box-containing protein
MLVTIDDVRRALDSHQLIPYFQPVAELHTGRLTSFEVLARWQHPEHAPILPENFIALAEENGLIEILTQQVLRKALLAAPLLPDPVSLAVNISATQLHDPRLPGQIQKLAEEAGFPPARLTIEVTESALLTDLKQTQTIVGELKAIGFHLALDDFGTGYSSLAHLQALPFDELKIDRSFVATMTSKRESRKIVAAIIGLGHSLGLITVAEGVETEEQADMLLWLGCGLGQGWLFGRPVTTGKIPALLASPLREVPVVLSAPGDGWAVSSLEALPTQRLAQLQAIYDGAPVGLCFLDCDMRYVSLNQKLAEMNGAPVSAHLGKTVEEMLPELFLRIKPYLQRAVHGEAMADVEVSSPSTVPGEPDRTVVVSYQPAWDEADEVIGVSIAVVDITQRKETEKSLRESVTRLQNIEERKSQVPWAMDAKGYSLQASSQWVPNTELSRKKMRNLSWLEALNPDDLAPVMKIMREALKTGKPIDIEYRVRSLDGEWKWMHSQGSPRFGPSGEILRWYGTVEDIDDRKRGEETYEAGKRL